jgi:Secretion system C-terminal sorting domain
MKQTTYTRGFYFPFCFTLHSACKASENKFSRISFVKVKNKLTAFLVAVSFISGVVSAQPVGPNLLTDPSFENTVVPVINGNNIIGVGINFGGWSCTNGGFNIIRVNGAGYTLGPDNAPNGTQYVDVASTDGYIARTFTLTTASWLYFSGSFSTRERGSSFYVNWTGRIDILNASNAVVASSNTMNFTNTTPKNNWYTLSGSSPLLPAGTYTYRAYTGNYGHFDNASARTGGIPLPVKLESFTANATDGKAILNWVVSEETNFSHYVIEKSTNGTTFMNLSTVFSNGNGNERKMYSAADKINSDYPVVYYRLRIVDIDGESSFSSIHIIKTGTSSLNTISVLTYPNPVSNELRITIPANWQNKNVSYEVLTCNGQLVKKIAAANASQTETINVSTLVPGFYVVMVKCNGEKAQQKIIKQ